MEIAFSWLYYRDGIARYGLTFNAFSGNVNAFLKSKQCFTFSV